MQETNTPTTRETLLSSAYALRQLCKDYYVLCKPRVVALMLLTVIVGMILASKESLSLSLMVSTLLGIGLVACSAAVINHLADQRIDAIMLRTRYRPLPMGRLTEHHALLFSLVLAVLGVSILWNLVNPLTTLLTLASMVGYALIYTFFLKRATPQNIVIGGLAGATPPLLGWTAVTGTIEPNGLLLALIIFVWTPPHFWALAIHRYEDYKKVEIPMLPVTHGIIYTKLNILLYTILLTIVTVLPYLTQLGGRFYLLCASVLNFGFLYYAVRMYVSDANHLPRQTFGYSIIYLLLLFVALLIDHGL